MTLRAAAILTLALGIAALVPTADAAAGSGAKREAASVYDLKAELDDQDGRSVGLDVHRGHPVVITMFYATCPHACPVLISDLKRIEARLDEGVRDSARFLLVSIDPERDDREVRRRLADMHGLDTSRWTLAKTDAASVRRIAAVLGIKYRRVPDGSFNHSSVITVLDGQGRSIHSVEGLGLAHDESVATLTRLARPPEPEVPATPSASR